MNDVAFARDILSREACRMLAHDLTVIAWEMKHEVGPFQEALFLFASMTERTCERVYCVLHSLRILLANAEVESDGIVSQAERLLVDLQDSVVRPLKHARSASADEVTARETITMVVDKLWHIRECSEQLVGRQQS